MLTSLSRTAFIGRDEQIIAYRNFLSLSSPWLLLLTGMPGCGKSFFLKHMRELFSPTTLMLSLDFADTSLQTDPLTLLSELSWQCAQQCDTRKVEAFRHELQASRQRLIQQHTTRLDDANDRLQHSPDNIAAIESLLADTTTEEAEIAIIEPVQQALLTQLATLPAETNLTVIFDTCEWIIAPQGQPVGKWLLEQFLPTLHQQCHCHVVMASRTPMPLSSMLAASSTRIELKGLEETAVTTYLLDIGIQDEVGQHIYRITHGHPLCFAIITALWQDEYQNNPTTTIDQEQNLAQLDDAYSEQALIELVQERLDQRLPSPYREWTHYGILLRRFNKDVLKNVFPELPWDEEKYQYFVDYLYVQPLGSGWYTIHEFLRETLFEIVRHKEPDRWQYYHQNARRYYKQQSVPLSYEQHYHAVASDEIAGLKQWYKALLDALGLSPVASWIRTTTTPAENTNILFHILDDKALQLSSEGKALHEDSKRDITLQLDRKRKNEELQQQSGYDNANIRAKEVANELIARSEQKRVSRKDWRRLRIAIPMILVIFLLLGYTIHALFFPPSSPNLVTSLKDSGEGSLRQVIANASPGSTITFAPQLHGMIILNDELEIKRNITILGSDPQQIAISNGHHQDVQIHVASGTTVFFDNLTFTRSLVLQNSFIYNEGNLTLNNCHVTGNISYNNGGGVTNHGGTLAITDSNISQNFASSNGGGIYSDNNGTLTVSNSIIALNTAYENGGGIYSLTGTVNLGTKTQITKNQAVHNDHSRGGGVTIQDALLNITGTRITANWTQGPGGGISILGSIANIDSSVIVDNMSSQAQGRELAVEVDPDNKKISQVILADLALPGYSGHPLFYIGHSKDNQKDQNIILGKISTESSRPEISGVSVDKNNPIGTPAPDQFPAPEASPNYVGNIDIGDYCRSIKYPSPDTKDPFHLKCSDEHGVQVPVDTLQICKVQKGENVTTDRLANYFDPTSWQCYSNATRLEPGPFMTMENVQKFCQHAGNIGGYNIGSTAYDWKCLHARSKLHSNYPIHLDNFPDKFPVGLSVDDMCGYIYQDKIEPSAKVMYRLTDYNKPNGWECWELLP